MDGQREEEEEALWLTRWGTSCHWLDVCCHLANECGATTIGLFWRRLMKPMGSAARGQKSQRVASWDQPHPLYRARCYCITPLDFRTAIVENQRTVGASGEKRNCKECFDWQYAWLRAILFQTTRADLECFCF